MQQDTRVKSGMLPKDLPDDLPTCMAPFGTAEQSWAYRFEVRWQGGFCFIACGHDRAWAHKLRLIDKELVQMKDLPCHR